MARAKEVLIEDNKQIPLVEEVELFAHERETGCKAVVDMTSMDTICVVNKENKLIQHQHVLKEVEKLDNFIVKKIQMMSKGRLMMIELVEREPKQIELLPKDYLECGARVFNDYGKSKGLSVQGWAMRMVCENGLVAPKVSRKMEIHAYGTSEFSSELEEQILASLKVWQESIDLFKRASEIKISVKDMLEEHSFLPRKYMDIVVGNLKDQETIYDIWCEYTRAITHDIAPHAHSIGVISLQRKANKILAITADYKEV